MSESQAAAIVSKRRLARSSLIEFTKFTYDDYAVAPHHKIIAANLELVMRGECLRLMLFMPPRHGKSELASRRFPAYFLGKYPKKQIIACSYNSELASSFGREVRNIVDSTEYRALFSTRLAEDSQAAGQWHTDKKGVYNASGIGTGTTGKGAHILLIDDPVKDWEEAESETRREAIWNWYLSTAYTRLMPGGAIILIMTRWHDDDLAGRLLKEMASGGDQWKVVLMPAINETGDALWDEWYGKDRLAQIKRAVGPRVWESLYQQNPVPEQGGYFQRSWFKRYTDVPKYLRVYGASDYAVTGNGGDFTVHGVFGVDQHDDIYILDWWKEQSSSDMWVDKLIDLIKKWRPLEWAEESGQIEKGVGPFINKRQQEVGAYCYRKQFASSKDKPTRAQSVRGRLAQGKVYFPSTPWADDIITEALRFPVGKNDDQVDVLSLIGRMLDDLYRANVPKEPEKAKTGWSFNELRDLAAKTRRRFG